MTKIKICGMTCEEDIKAVNKYFAGLYWVCFIFSEK